jgi:hypothetical protein
MYVAAIQVAKLDASLRFTTRASSHGLIVQLTRDNSPWLWRLPGMGLLVPVWSRACDFTLRHGVGVVWREHERFWREERASWEPLACLREKGALPADMVVSCISIGTIGYYLASTTLIDEKGLTDRHVAHMQTPRANEQRYMAHDRSADEEYLLARGVNARVRASARDPRSALEHAGFALHACNEVWMAFDTRDAAWAGRAFRGRELWGWTVAQKVGTFESGTDGWTLEGVFAGGPRTGLVPGRARMWPPHGSGIHNLDSRDASGSARGTGNARSPAFDARAGVRLSVRLVGDSHGGAAGARLVCAGETVRELKSLQPNSFVPVLIDLAPYAGRPCVLEVFDDSDDAWVGAGDVVLLAPGPIEP